MRVAKAVVTGGAGFIGSHIVDELVTRDIETHVVDDLSTGRLENLGHLPPSDLLHVHIGDARSIGRLLGEVENIDILFHEAAIANVLRSVRDPMAVHDVNVNMSLEIMNFCREKEIRRMVFASSAAVYGLLGEKKASEEMACRPSSPYGATKLCIEDYLHAYKTTYGLEPVMLRYFNVFGPRQAASDYSGVITIFTNRMLKGEPVTIFGDGGQTRDFVNVKDIVQANMLAMDEDAAVGEVFNVASGQPTSVLELFETLRSMTHSDGIEPIFEAPRPGDVRFGTASIDKIRSTLGYERTVPMEQGLRELLQHAISQSEMNVRKAQQRY
jgi:UDP-glucose 4-epimerase